MSPPVVSVVIPTYNRADLLPSALDSVLAQTHPHLEVLVVDDGSTDDTLRVLEGYGERIAVVRQDNAGPSAARNHGIRKTTGAFVAFLDSDDVWLPDKLARQLEVFAAHPDTGMVGGGCRYMDAEGNDLGGVTRCPHVIPLEDFQIFTALPGSASNAVIRRKALEEVGLFDDTLQRAEDRELWMRIAERYPVRGVPEPTVLIRVHGGERPNDSFSLVRESRRRVNQRIADPAIRRKADAWMWYSFGDRLMGQGQWMRGLAYVGRSFLTHPSRINRRKSRLIPTVDRLLPDWLNRGARRLLKRRG